ncbi:hypothetical protein BJY04DRAFT_213524 [Aspergillus karnatakaensis]|uniref:uncharacterized protein n=1 Tax=Aspergillus karnatakaensis TaxID=1810916 RepID=UPI003CCD7063
MSASPTSSPLSISLGPGILSVILSASDYLVPPPHPDPEKQKKPLTVAEAWEPWLLYALVEYDGLQISIRATGGPYHKEAFFVWSGNNQIIKFDVPPFPPTEMVVSFLVRNRDPDRPTGFGQQVLSLGKTRIDPFHHAAHSPDRGASPLLYLEGGPGRARLAITYETKAPSSKFLTGGKTRKKGIWGSFNELVYAEKHDSGRCYGRRSIDIGTKSIYNEASGSIDASNILTLNLRNTIRHPFIAPLKYAYKSLEGPLELLSPLGGGGYLFTHLQAEQRFCVDKAKFYAAELICILEYLHDQHIVLASLNPENILVDSSGHLNLCSPGLFALDLGSIKNANGDLITPGLLQFPAPELLNGQEPSTAVDWWSLGITLCEMLIGLPPFYHENHDQRTNKILVQDLQLPNTLPPDARDILTSLLKKSPTERLGAAGAASVKAHTFFHDISWHKLRQRETPAPWVPHDAATIFWRNPESYQPSEPLTKERRELEGEIYENIGSAERPLWVPIGRVNEDRYGSKVASSLPEDDANGWELVWESTSQEFRFNNRFTGETASAKIDDPHAGHYMILPGESDPLLPSKSQIKEALATALIAGHSQQVFTQILAYKVDLNTHILIFDQVPSDLEVIPLVLDQIHLSPLEWAVEHERLDLVSLFLNHGADANFTISPRQGPALVKAIRKKHHEMIDLLLPKTNRVSRTRALALAVELKDFNMVNNLLAHGVHPDFEATDRPLPRNPLASYDNDQCHGPRASGDLRVLDFTPPLVRAARLGNKDIAKLLLVHGADPNIAYHELGGLYDRPLQSHEYVTTDHLIPAAFSCGRPIHIALERGHTDVVELLLDAVADVDLPHEFWPVPVWPVPGHICPPVPREIYLEVMSRLKEAVNRRRA